MGVFIIKSLRGGLNNSFPAISLADDQVTVATNIEFVDSMLGERRRGTDNITLPASISAHDRVTFLHRHVPGNDETASELWVLGVTGTSSCTLSRKTTSWSDATFTDTPTLTGFSQYQWVAVSHHGKLYIAYDSSVDRLHVIDASGTTVRRTGLAEPSAPTGANNGSGTFTGTRYYRIRYTVKSGSTVLRRSEPSDSLTFAPSGTGSGITVTKPSSISESETHWELEASLDNVNFYVIADTAVGTTTVTDTQDYALGYAVDFDLSEDVGDYSLLPSARYLVVDEDRLLLGGSWEDSSLASRVLWTPVEGADGDGNDERWEADTDPFVDLDGLEGGGITGMSQASLGTVWVFKTRGIYKLVRSGIRSRAYDAVCYSKDLGAIHGSVVSAVDEQGRPCVYFIDPAVGPCRVGSGGIRRCGDDIETSWSAINLSATKVTCSGIFYPAAKQVIWCIATGSSNTPDLGIVLHTTETRDSDSGIHRGWVTWSGKRIQALTMCLYASNIEAGTARNKTLKPFIALEGNNLVHLTDTGSDDDGTAYAARIVTKPYEVGNLLQRFGIQAGALLAKAVTGAVIDVKLIRDFGLETVKTVSNVSLAATASETSVIKTLDNFSGSNLRVAEFEFVDPATPGTRFELNQLCLTNTPQGVMGRN